MNKSLDEYLNEKKKFVDGHDIAIGFDFNGAWVTNPYLDETGRDKVDPIKEYKEAYTNSDLIEVEMRLENIKRRVEAWKKGEYQSLNSEGGVLDMVDELNVSIKKIMSKKEYK